MSTDQRDVQIPQTLRARLDSRLMSTAPTQLVQVALRLGRRRRKLWLKLESGNRSGSIKERTALSLVASVADRLDGADPVLIESTSGNLGVALAGIAGEFGLRFVAVVDPTLPPPLGRSITDLGGVLELVVDRSASGYLPARLRRVRELCQSIPHAVWPNQYENPANQDAHYRTTGPEIVTQTHGTVDAVFVAVSTGGTVAGIGRYLRSIRSPACRVAVDVVGSIALTGEPGPRKLTGIGAGRRSRFADPDCYDDAVFVDSARAIAFCRELYATTGLYVGGSSGAVLAACVDFLAHHPEIENPICVCADGGENYVDTIYDDAWLARQQISLSGSLLHTGTERAAATFEQI